MTQLSFAFMQHCRGWSCAWGAAAKIAVYAHRAETELDDVCLCKCGRCVQRLIVANLRTVIPFSESVERLKRRQAQVGWQ